MNEKKPYEKPILEEVTPKIFYICDRRKCYKCNEHCSLTAEIRHAKNFEINPCGNYVEKPEQQPKKPLFVSGIAYCRDCGGELPHHKMILNYCPVCGQRLDFSEETK